jgi:predicted permease
LLLALTGGAAGLLVSRWLSDVVRGTLLPNLASSERFVDTRVLVATLVAACVVGLGAGLAPLAQIAQRHLAAELQSQGGHSSLRRSGFQGVLVGLQVALCTVLLVGAGLFVRSLQRVQSQDLGFTTVKLLYVTLDFREALPGSERDSVYAASVRRIHALPGVTGASIVQAMPFGHFHVPPISVPGLAEPPAIGGQLPMMYGATRQYLDLMGVRLREGRLLEESDGRLAPPVVLVNETMARTVWPGQSALGKCIRIGFDPNLPPSPLAPASLPCRQVVGVVRDSRVRSLRATGNEARLMQYYVPFAQLPAMPFGGDAPQVNAMLVGTAHDPEPMIAGVQRLIQGTSTSPVYARVRLYQDLLDPQLRPWRLGATLFSAFGGLALGIAAVGLFGVVSYLVTQRTREIGVRLALGGTRRMVSGWVVRDALRLVAVGIGAGLLVALVSAPLMQSMLFDTTARDVGVLAAAAGMLLAVTILAAALPAWRAGRVSPMTALRSD